MVQIELTDKEAVFALGVLYTLNKNDLNGKMLELLHTTTNAFFLALWWKAAEKK